MPEKFLVILMVLTLLSANFCGVCDAAITRLTSSTPSTPYTALHIHAHLDLEQQVCNAEALHSSLPSEAFSTKSNLPCSPTICTNCKKQGHLTDFCIQKGSGMAGKSIGDAMAAQWDHWFKGKSRGTFKTSDSSFSKDTTSKSGSPVLQDSNNCTYILDPATNMAYLLSEAASTSSTSC